MTAYTKTVKAAFAAHTDPTLAVHAETQYDDAKAEYQAGNWGRYVNSACGKSTFTAAATLDITHGMSSTPTKVLVTGSDTNSSSLWVTAIGAVTFTINRGNSTGTPDVYWYAEL
jgi:hypothetical protein